MDLKLLAKKSLPQVLNILLKATGKSRIDPANPMTWPEKTKIEYNKAVIETGLFSAPSVTPTGKVVPAPQGVADTTQDYEFDNTLRILKPIPYNYDDYKHRHPPRTKNL